MQQLRARSVLDRFWALLPPPPWLPIPEAGQVVLCRATWGCPLHDFAVSWPATGWQGIWAVDIFNRGTRTAWLVLDKRFLPELIKRCLPPFHPPAWRALAQFVATLQAVNDWLQGRGPLPCGPLEPDAAMIEAVEAEAILSALTGEEEP